MMVQTAKNLCFVIFISGLVTVFYLFISLKPAGYCKELKRALSDDELIAMAVRDEVTRGQILIDGSGESIRSFHAMHPNCCTVDRNVRTPIERLIGNDTVQVDLYYEVADSSSRPPVDEYYEAHVDVDACGKVGDRFGMRIAKKNLPAGVN